VPLGTRLLLAEKPAATTSRVQDAAKKFFDQMRAKAANEPRDPLDQRAHKSETQRRRDPDGRFAGARRNVEGVPRLPNLSLSRGCVRG
jgi:hypothetical protein